MNYSVENEYLKITVSDIGGDLVSVVSKADGCEYVWQGDPEFWDGQSPILFPVCCRLYGGYYTYEGRQYTVRTHGFVRGNKVDSVTVNNAGNTIKCVVASNDVRREQYPFEFKTTIAYKLVGNKVKFSITVRNLETNKDMYFADGGHPGFNVPLDTGAFEDWYVEFDEDKPAKRIIFSDTCFRTGKNEDYKLEDGKIIRLRHDLFDNDALFFSDMSKAVTLRSDKSSKFVRLEYPLMPYLGLWHAVKKPAPYLCIEPMNGLPSFDGKVDDLTNKSDMIKLAPGDTHTTGYDIIFGI